MRSKNEAAWQGSAKPEMPLLPVTGAGNRMKIKTCASLLPSGPRAEEVRKWRKKKYDNGRNSNK